MATTDAGGRKRPPGMLALLRQPTLRRYLGANVVSATGDWLYSVALVVLLFSVTGSTGWVAVAATARLAAYVVFSPVGGVLGDRFDRRRLLVRLDVALFVVLTLLTLAVMADLPAPFIVLGAVAVSSLGALYQPSLFALVPDLVDEDHLAPTNAAVATIEQVSMSAGPALGALLVAATSVALTFGVNAITFLVSAGLLAGLHLKSRARASAPAPPTTSRQDAADDGAEGADGADVDPRASGWASFREGIDALRSTPAARVLVGLMCASMVIYGFEMVLYVAVADDLGIGTSGFGWLTAAVGVGGIAAATFSARLAGRSGLGKWLIISALLAAAPMASLAFVSSVWVAVPVLVIEGAAFVVLEVLTTTMLQRTVADTVLARVFGVLMSLTAAATVLGNVVGATVSELVDLQAALVLGPLLLAGYVTLAARPLRRVIGAAEARREELGGRVDVLRALAIFGPCSQASLERLAGAAIEERVAGGAAVISEGEPADDLFLVRTGTFEVRSRGEAQGEDRLVNTMGTDDWFGEIGLLERTARTATVTASGPATVWRIPGDVFLEAITEVGVVPDPLRLGMAARVARTHPNRAVTTR